MVCFGWTLSCTHRKGECWFMPAHKSDVWWCVRLHRMDRRWQSRTMNIIGSPTLRYRRAEPPLAQCSITAIVVAFGCAYSECPSFFGGENDNVYTSPTHRMPTWDDRYETQYHMPNGVKSPSRSIVVVTSHIYIKKIKIHSSCEIEDFVETHLCKLCVILRSRALRVVCPH